ncbi:DUF6364 family protein [Pedobacter alluvionis]|uniref:Antitoxin n=1 Tax=Pedobacter alluvionis TaxID=475253 RepID=A0A497XV63_9SPHI|nr:DUF6364 family protein [Pedobacter alluvionis]RLJ73514.1 hypothetical protein BCL90_3671 [Pedobacter alluvionis]TFB32853.1 hypothetical protein E3V97_02095 [Pedobacter alluvionis]
MTTKLTLTVQKSTIEKAKSYAKQTGRSLSELVEKYLETITLNEVTTVSSKLRGIVGAVKLPDDFDDDAELHDYFERKHL